MGVIVNNKLKWDDHINSIVLRANILIGRLRKVFSRWDPITFRILYKTYVRPILEYASSVWYALKKSHIKRLEDVQRRATKSVPVIRNKSYLERLKLLDIPTLESRRIRGDLIQYFKFINGINRIEWFHPNSISPASNAQGPASSIRNANKIYKQFVFSSEPRRNFFSNRIVNNWNSLRDSVKNSENVEKFKNNYDNYFKTFEIY